MTVKNLIEMLGNCDPDAHVRAGTFCGTVDGIINGIHCNIISPSNGKQCVYLEFEITHFEGEKMQDTIARKKTILQLHRRNIIKRKFQVG